MKFRKTAASTLLIAVLLTVYVIDSLFQRNSILNVSALETAEGIGVYWNRNCSTRVSSINWGILSIAEVKRFVVYVKNEGNRSLLLVVTPANWNPENASYYLNFSWTCEYNRVEANEVVNVTLSLHISPYTQGISNFSFDIIFEMRMYCLGDINGDGIVNICDVTTICSIFGSTTKDPNWNPDADLDKNGAIDFNDVVLVMSEYGKTWKP